MFALPSVKAALLSVTAALVLGACAASNEEVKLGAIKPTCPTVAALADYDRLTRFTDTTARDITDISWDARIKAVQGVCYFEDPREEQGMLDRMMGSDLPADVEGRIVTDFTVAVELTRGPANDGTNVSVPLVMLLVDSFDRVMLKRDFTAEFDLQNQFRTALWRSEFSQSLPAKGPAGGAGYQVLVGIKMNKEDLAWNKTRR